MKVAIVHDWLTNFGGAEGFVESLLKLYPDADIYTLVYNKKNMKGHFENNKIYTSKLQKIPGSTKIYTKLLKFMPKAFESFDFTGYDLVICSSSSCAKGVIVPPYVPQIAYIHSPMRYAWDLYFDYQKRSGKLTRFFMDKWMSNIRLWDYISSQRIDTVLANSKYIARRIKKFWNLDAQVVNCPIKTHKFTPGTSPKEDFYVFFSRLVPYKRADLAIEACIKLNKNLVVIGGGTELEKLQKLASGHKNIVFTGRASDELVLEKLQKAKAMLFCAEEDFGLTPIEAQACGTPVIAFGRGGACETVIDHKTGLFFEEQTVDSLCKAITEFEKPENKDIFNKDFIVEHAKSFSEERFQKEFLKVVEETVNKIKIKY